MTATARPLSVVPDAPAAPSLEDDVRALIGYTDAIAQLTAQVDRIKARLRTELAPGNHPLAGVTVGITQARRFSAEKAATVLTADQLAAITETTTAVSAALAKRVLPPVVYDELTEAYGEPRVTVKA